MATSWETIKKIGSGWAYNEATYTYNQLTDDATGAIVFYNKSGVETTWTALNKP